MAEQRKRNTRYVTDKATLVYPHLIPGKPDTKFVGSGVYHTYLKLPVEAELADAKTGKSQGKITDFLAEKLDESFERFKEENKGKKKKGKPVEVTVADPPFYVDEDENVLYVKTKLNAYVEPANSEAFTQAPALFDSKGKPTKPKRMWNGTIAKAAFEVIPYFNQKDSEAGITLRLKAAQIIELSTGGEMDGGAFGFGQEEGFESGEEPEEEEEDDEEDDDGFNHNDGDDGEEDKSNGDF